MMDDQDITPKTSPVPIAAALPQSVLEAMGVTELESYVATLRSEMARAEAQIARKQSHRATADSFFRTAR